MFTGTGMALMGASPDVNRRLSTTPSHHTQPFRGAFGAGDRLKFTQTNTHPASQKPPAEVLTSKSEPPRLPTKDPP